jgi:hypothetical protein
MKYRAGVEMVAIVLVSCGISWGLLWLSGRAAFDQRADLIWPLWLFYFPSIWVFYSVFEMAGAGHKAWMMVVIPLAITAQNALIWYFGKTVSGRLRRRIGKH